MNRKVLHEFVLKLKLQWTYRTSQHLKILIANLNDVRMCVMMMSFLVFRLAHDITEITAEIGNRLEMNSVHVQLEFDFLQCVKLAVATEKSFLSGDFVESVEMFSQVSLAHE